MGIHSPSFCLAFPFVSSFGHPVADAELVEDIGGVFEVISEFAAQALYHGAQGTKVGVGLKPPDPSQQMLVAQYG